MCILMYVYVHIYIYIYIYARERERERERLGRRELLRRRLVPEAVVLVVLIINSLVR